MEHTEGTKSEWVKRENRYCCLDLEVGRGSSSSVLDESRLSSPEVGLSSLLSLDGLPVSGLHLMKRRVRKRASVEGKRRKERKRS